MSIGDPPQPLQVDGSPPGAKSSVIKETKEVDDEKGSEEGLVIREAYVKVTTAQWQWPEAVGPWLKNALTPFVHTDALTRNDGHPLCAPDEESVLLYEVKDSTGGTSLCFSLKQLEYIQYYIHETRMADPVWVKHVTAFDDIDEPHPSDAEVGPPEYPEGEEWLPLPDTFIYGSKIVSVEQKRFTDSKELKRYLSAQRRTNKQVQTRRWQAGEPEYDEEKAKAMADNARPGPGLRRGPERQRNYPPRTREDEEEDASVPDPNNPLDARPLEKKVDQAKSLPNQSKLKVEVEPDTSTGPTTLGMPASVDAPEPPSNFSSAYYNHARQALQLASVGGMFEAYKGLPEYASLMPSSAQGEPPIGRSLFISIRVVTWEMDAEVLLEVGWSALWFQENPGQVAEGEDKYDELREQGHIIVQDQLLDKRNGNLKPDYRSDYLYGNSIPLASADIKDFMKRKLEDLGRRAGGGPIYIVLHSTDGQHADPGKSGLETKDWYRQFRPSSWEHPVYTSADGVGKTFVIDTAILFSAVEAAPKVVPSPIKTELTLEEVAWKMFPNDRLRTPMLYGNAGNDAFYNLEVFLALIMASSLEHMRTEYQQIRAGSGTSEELPDMSSLDIAPLDGQSIGTPEPNALSGDDIHRETALSGAEDGNYSSDEELPGIKGVYVENSDGELVELTGDEEDEE